MILHQHMLQMLKCHQHISTCMGDAMPMQYPFHASGMWIYSLIRGSIFSFYMIMSGWHYILWVPSHGILLKNGGTVITCALTLYLCTMTHYALCLGFILLQNNVYLL